MKRPATDFEKPYVYDCSPIIQKSYDKLVGAKDMQKREAKSFMKIKEGQLEKVLVDNGRVMKAIPNVIMSQRNKNHFLRVRKTSMQRNYLTDAKNRVISEWTLPRMIIKSHLEEKMKKLREKELAKALEFKKKVS